MNKLKQHIMQSGEYVGMGSTRIAIRLNNRVYKFPYRPTGYNQSANEQTLFKQLTNKSFFPNPQFLSNGVVVVDYIPPLEDLIGYYSDNPVEDIINNQLSSVEQIKDFLKLMIVLANMNICVDEFTHNGGNLGVKNGDIYILDWGTLNLDEVRSSSPKYYEYIHKLLAKFNHNPN